MYFISLSSTPPHHDEIHELVVRIHIHVEAQFYRITQVVRHEKRPNQPLQGRQPVVRDDMDAHLYVYRYHRQ